jgi:ectoine hydroxylase-related dioxygenase (phytanoyl-CoA dioxygenase family)
LSRYSIDTDGFSMVENFLPRQEVADLVNFVERNLSGGDRRGGVRNLLDFFEMRDLAASSAMRIAVKTILGSGVRVVRGILFDKTEGANWKVPWHQDVTIAVNQKVEAAGFGPWSVKAGVLHVQPPASVLERMVSVRLHLDDCPAQNGALRVIAGSHTSGKLNERLIQGFAERSVSVTCAMQSGGALMMRPLLLHASSSSSFPGHRRVIHFDYAAAELPAGMGWAETQS